MFFKYNTQLGPPYQVLVDTNFINFSIKNKVRGWHASCMLYCYNAAGHKADSLHAGMPQGLKVFIQVLHVPKQTRAAAPCSSALCS